VTCELSLRGGVRGRELGLKLGSGLVQAIGSLARARALWRSGRSSRSRRSSLGGRGGLRARACRRAARCRCACLGGPRLSRCPSDVLRATERLHDPGHEAVHPLQSSDRLGRRAGMCESSCQSAEVSMNIDRNLKQ